MAIVNFICAVTYAGPDLASTQIMPATQEREINSGCQDSNYARDFYDNELFNLSIPTYTEQQCCFGV
jgi:hypothetical protein